MPIFDFKCEHCNIKEEHLVSLNEEVKCQICGDIMIKQLSCPHFKLEGVGVYNHSGSFGRNLCELPINIIDQKADGTYSVHTTSKKKPELIEE